MSSHRRRISALVAAAGAFVSSLLVATPASAEPPLCDDIVLADEDGVIQLREDDPWTVSIDCSAYPVSDADLQVTVVTGPEHGVLGPVSFRPRGVNASHGSHEVTYDPDDDYIGTDRFILNVSDGTESTDFVVDVQMDPNRKPSCNQHDAVYDHVLVDETWSMTLTCDDLDLQDYATLEPMVSSQPLHGSLQLALTDDSLGTEGLTITYTPDPGFTGSEHFVAGVTDGDLADVDDFYLNVANTPWCHPSEPVEVRAGTTVQILPYCTQPGLGELETNLPTPPQHGSIAFHRMAIYYTADPAASGPDPFTFQASGVTGVSNVVTQEVTILPNAAPVCDGLTLSTPTGESVDVPLTCTDTDGDEHTVTIEADPEHGTLGPIEDGTVTYTPDAGYDGVDGFSYVASDDVRTSDPASVTVAVTEEVAPVITVRLAQRTPAQTARRGVVMEMYLSEPVDVDAVVRVPWWTARRLDLPRRTIATVTQHVDADLARVFVPLTRKAARAVGDVRRLPLRATVRATDEWGNATERSRRAVLGSPSG